MIMSLRGTFPRKGIMPGKNVDDAWKKERAIEDNDIPDAGLPLSFDTRTFCPACWHSTRPLCALNYVLVIPRRTGRAIMVAQNRHSEANKSGIVSARVKQRRREREGNVD